MSAPPPGSRRVLRPYFSPASDPRHPAGLGRSRLRQEWSFGPTGQDVCTRCVPVDATETCLLAALPLGVLIADSSGKLIAPTPPPPACSDTPEPISSRATRQRRRHGNSAARGRRAASCPGRARRLCTAIPERVSPGPSIGPFTTRREEGPKVPSGPTVASRRGSRVRSGYLTGVPVDQRERSPGADR